MNLLRSKGVLLLVVMSICSFSVLNVRQAMAYNNPFKISFFNTDENGEGESESGEGESENGENSEGESGEGSFEDRCKNAGYSYNESLRADATQSETINVTCEIAGQITVWGVTIIDVAYKKGGKYPMFKDVYSCISSPGNCCDPSKQGTYVNSRPELSPV